jgi:putative transposase
LLFYFHLFRIWEIFETFWALVEPLIPVKEREADKTYRRKPGDGRKQSRFSGLAEYHELEGIAWQGQSADGSMQKAPLAQESNGQVLAVPG